MADRRDERRPSPQSSGRDMRRNKLGSRPVTTNTTLQGSERFLRPTNLFDIDIVVTEATKRLNFGGKKVFGPPIVSSDDIVLNWTHQPSEIKSSKSFRTDTLMNRQNMDVIDIDETLPDASGYSWTSRKTFPSGLIEENRNRIIVFRSLPRNVAHSEISKLLFDYNFTANDVREICVFSGGSTNLATVEFVHQEKTKAALSALQDIQAPFWRQGHHTGRLLVERWLCSSSQPVEDQAQTSSSPERDTTSREIDGMREDHIVVESDEDSVEIVEEFKSNNQNSRPIDFIKIDTSSDSDSGVESDTNSQGTQPRGTRTISLPAPGLISSWTPIERPARRSLPKRSNPENSLAQPPRYPRIHDGDSSTQRSSNIPRTPHGKARRILVPATEGCPLATISMRADLQFFDRKQRFRISAYSIPNKGLLCCVQDACITGDKIIVGYDVGPCQVSVLSLKENTQPRLIDIEGHRPHKFAQAASSDCGVTSLAPVGDSSDGLKFLSGGSDKQVYLWTLKGKDFKQCRYQSVNVTNAGISAVAFRCSDATILSAAGSQIWTQNILRPSTTVRSALCSSRVNQIHVHPQAPSVTILEVNHLEHQVQIFDSRNGGFDRSPCIHFGHRSKINETESRHSKGSVNYHLFLKGYKDGIVKLWDFRQAKYPVVVQEHQLAEHGVHSSFCGPMMAIFSKTSVTFLDKNGNRLS